MPIGRKLANAARRVGQAIKSYPGSLSPERRRARASERAKGNQLKTVQRELSSLQQQLRSAQQARQQNEHVIRQGIVEMASVRGIGARQKVLKKLESKLAGAKKIKKDAEKKLSLLNKQNRGNVERAHLIARYKGRLRSANSVLQKWGGSAKQITADIQARKNAGIQAAKTTLAAERLEARLQQQIQGLTDRVSDLRVRETTVASTPASALHPPKPVGRFERFMSTPLNESIRHFEEGRRARRRARAGGTTTPAGHGGHP